MKISLLSISVLDQDKALAFYSDRLGFQKKHDIDMGGGSRWLTLVSPDDPDGPELLLEPNAGYPAMKALKESLVADGIPFTALEVDDVRAEVSLLEERGVVFTGPAVDAGSAIFAVFDDTCGNLIQIFQTVEK